MSNLPFPITRGLVTTTFGCVATFLVSEALLDLDMPYVLARIAQHHLGFSRVIYALRARLVPFRIVRPMPLCS